MKEAKIVYCAGFFITVSPPTMVALGQHTAENYKTFCLNLSAPFICQFFKDPLLEVMPYVDFLFGANNYRIYICIYTYIYIYPLLEAMPYVDFLFGAHTL